MKIISGLRQKYRRIKQLTKMFLKGDYDSCYLAVLAEFRRLLQGNYNGWGKHDYLHYRKKYQRFIQEHTYAKLPNGGGDELCVAFMASRRE